MLIDPTWPDAFTMTFIQPALYVRVSINTSTVEPIDDYPFNEFLEWSDLYADYLTIIRLAQKWVPFRRTGK